MFKILKTVGILILIVGLCLMSVMGSELSPDKISFPADFYKKEVKKDPNSQLLYEALLAEIATERAQHEVAIKYYLMLARSTNDPRYAREAAAEALLVDDYATAKKALLIWLNIAPDNITALRTLVVLLIITKEDDSSILSHLTHLLTLKKSNTDDIEWINQQLVLPEEQETLRNNLEKTVKANPKNIKAGIALASINIETQHYQDAMQIIDKILASYPDNISAVILKSTLYLTENKPELSLELLKEKSLQYPKEEVLRFLYAKLLLENNQVETAKPIFIELSKTVKYKGIAYISLSYIAIIEGKLNDAETLLLKATDDPAQKNFAYYLLGQLASFNKKDADAIIWYSKVSSGKYFLESQIRAAEIMAVSGDSEKALQYLAKISPRNVDDNRIIAVAMAKILIDLDKYTAAIIVIDNALDLSPKDPQLLYLRILLASKLHYANLVNQLMSTDVAIEVGEMLWKSGEYNTARFIWQQALSKDPKNKELIDLLQKIKEKQN